MQFLSHEILLVAEFFDPLNAFWVDEKGAHTGAQEVGKARGGSRKRFDENPRCSLRVYPESYAALFLTYLNGIGIRASSGASRLVIPRIALILIQASLDSVRRS